MLEDMGDELRFSIPVELDEDGYVDKECPSENCMFIFKVFGDDWKNLFKDGAVFCPYCRHEASADSFWTTEQIERAKEEGFKQVMAKVGGMLRDMAKDFNRQQPNKGFITMKMSVKGLKPSSIILPIKAQKEMELKIKCDECNARCAIIGSAFFCPCCGHNSANRTFDDSMKKVETKLKNIDVVRQAISELNQDDAEVTCRSIIESGLSDCVVAFQRFCEITYSNHPSASPSVPFNVFQRINDGSNLWKTVFGEGYEDWISEDEMKKLKKLYQKRHLLSHCEGIVNQKYIDRSGDPDYQVGQRIVIKDSDILELLNLIKKLVKRIRKKM